MKYRKKPVEVEAEQWWPGKQISGVISCVYDSETMTWAVPDDLPEGLQIPWQGYVQTLEGNLIVSPGDWVITGVKGEVYPCKPDIFEQTYEPVN